jgi:hypothetical protein
MQILNNARIYILNAIDVMLKNNLTRYFEGFTCFEPREQKNPVCGMSSTNVCLCAHAPL